uniref:Uncharacterized protein n=1 Tax=Daphnia galeata TaxID=27404 RepID=A0A8J2REJ6_9CRUS|nr:unnamed protein product [Daphnia galeata]
MLEFCCSCDSKNASHQLAVNPRQCFAKPVDKLCRSLYFSVGRQCILQPDFQRATRSAPPIRIALSDATIELDDRSQGHGFHIHQDYVCCWTITHDSIYNYPGFLAASHCAFH